MSTAVQDLFDRAMALSQPDREDLVALLVRHVEGPPPAGEEQVEIDRVWAAEIERRVRDVEEGRVELVDGDEVLKRLRAGQRP